MRRYICLLSVGLYVYHAVLFLFRPRGVCGFTRSLVEFLCTQRLGCPYRRPCACGGDGFLSVANCVRRPVPTWTLFSHSRRLKNPSTYLLPMEKGRHVGSWRGGVSVFCLRCFSFFSSMSVLCAMARGAGCVLNAGNDFANAFGWKQRRGLRPFDVSMRT